MSRHLPPHPGDADVTFHHPHRTRSRVIAGVVAAAAALAVAVPAASAATATKTLWAVPSQITFPGSPAPVVANTWRFTDLDPSANPVPAGVGGPLIEVTEGDNLTITLYNRLYRGGSSIANLSLSLPQAGGTIYGHDGAAGRRGTDKTGVAAGHFATYTLNGLKAGTYLYEAGPTDAGKRQVAMGLYGVLIVRPAGGGTAYGPGTAYNTERVMLLSEFDVNMANSTTPYPESFPFHDYDPDHWLINGATTAQAPAMVAAGQTALIRYVNAGVDTHWMGLLGLHQNRIAFDAQRATAATPGVVAALQAGSTADTLVAVPGGTAAGTVYPLFDEGLELDVPSSHMVDYLQVGSGTLPTCGATGAMPASVQGMQIVGGNSLLHADASLPNLVITATAPACRGASNYAAHVAFSLDHPGSPGEVDGGTHVAYANGVVTVTIPQSELLSLVTPAAAGSAQKHRVFLRAQSAGGTWGEAASIAFTIDNLGPDIIETVREPAAANHMTKIHVWATADESTTGGSAIRSFTWAVAGVPTCTGGGDLMAGDPPVATPAPSPASLEFEIDPTCAGPTGFAFGSHTITIHATDTFGNTTSDDPAINTLEPVTFTVDNDKPVLSAMAMQQRLRIHPPAQTLNGAVSATASTINVTPATVAANLPALPFNATIQDETVQVTAVDATGAQWTVVRAMAGTAASHPSATAIGVPDGTPGAITDRNNGTLSWEPNLFAVRALATATDPTSDIAQIRGTFDTAGFCDVTDPSAAGARLDPRDGQFDALAEIGFAYIPLSELNTLLTQMTSMAAPDNSVHAFPFYFRAADAAGNWSDCASVDEIMDRTIPTAQAIATVTEGGGARVQQAATGAATGLRLSGTGAAGAGDRITAAEWFDGADPGVEHGNPLRASDGVFNSPNEAFRGQVSTARWTPGVHRLSMRVRDAAGNWSAVVTRTVTVRFRPVFSDGFESGGLRKWAKKHPSASVSADAALAGRYGLLIRSGGYVTRAIGARPSLRTSFMLDTNGSATGGDIQSILLGRTSTGATMFAVQRRTTAAGQAIRLVAYGGRSNLTGDWVALSDDPHTVRTAWFAGTNGEAAIWVDGREVNRLAGLRLAPRTVTNLAFGATGARHARGSLRFDAVSATN